MDPFIMRTLLMIHLRDAGKQQLAKEHGGSNVFGPSWAQRFLKRHNLKRRVATTKMRELSADFLQKLEHYIRIGALIIFEYGVPPDLVIGCDETAVLFVPRSKYTYAVKGRKKIRLLGVGKDKDQITVTIFIVETGEVIDSQMIFGGKTNRCHPDNGRSASPTGIHWDHSESHWQNYATFIKAIENIVILYKNAKISELGLPFDQKTILKMDLHFSHKINPSRPNELAQELKVLLEMHNIIPFYVPGACTDELQECDTVIHKPFKARVKASFRDYLYRQYETWVSEGNDAEEWAPKFGMAELKPNITGWIQDGIAAIRTPEMKLSIKKAFFTDGRFEEIRSRALSQKKADAQQQELWEELMLYEEPETIEEIPSGGDLVIATFEEPNSDLDNLI